jgi:tRNA-dihydrouridine synthase B
MCCPNFRQIRVTFPIPPQLKPISVGPVEIACPVILAPMTGVTDLPFRKLVRRFGSGLNVTERRPGSTPITVRRSSTSTWAARSRRWSMAMPDRR